MTEEELAAVCMAYALGIPCQWQRGTSKWFDLNFAYSPKYIKGFAVIPNEPYRFRIKPPTP